MAMMKTRGRVSVLPGGLCSMTRTQPPPPYYQLQRRAPHRLWRNPRAPRRLWNQRGWPTGLPKRGLAKRGLPKRCLPKRGLSVIVHRKRYQPNPEALLKRHWGNEPPTHPNGCKENWPETKEPAGYPAAPESGHPGVVDLVRYQRLMRY